MADLHVQCYVVPMHGEGEMSSQSFKRHDLKRFYCSWGLL